MKLIFLTVVSVVVLLTSLISCQRFGSDSNLSRNIDNSNANVPDSVIVEANNNNVEKKKDVDYFAHLDPGHREVLREWLKKKTFLRPASEEIDNGYYEEKYKDYLENNLRFLRETVGKDGYQYYAKGDFNKDKKEDFAVLLVDAREKDGDKDWFVLAIFNGPFKKGQLPNYYEENLHGISNSYIVVEKEFGNHLFLGKFESDFYCATYYPKGKTYRFKDCIE